MSASTSTPGTASTSTTVASDAATEASFEFPGLPTRVVFGPGRVAQLPEEVDRLGLSRVLVVCTPGRRALGARIVELLGAGAVSLFPQARMHVPVQVAEAGVDQARRLHVDGCVSVGGGSAIGLGKAIALSTGLPTLAVPTTYSGSEMTPVWGLTEAGDKRTGRDPAVLPRTAIYDPELTVGLDPAVAGTSGLNALAHAVEALYAPDRSPVVALMAEEAARSLAAVLPRLVADPDDLAGQAEALRGAWLAGCCLGATTMSLHHRICHVLGGLFDLPHAATHAVVLPSVVAANLPALPVARAALARAWTTDDPAAALDRLVREVGAPTSLQDLGLSGDALASAADAVLARPCANPQPLTRELVDRVLQAAWRGNPSNASP